MKNEFEKTKIKQRLKFSVKVLFRQYKIKNIFSSKRDEHLF